MPSTAISRARPSSAKMISTNWSIGARCSAAKPGLVLDGDDRQVVDHRRSRRVLHAGGGRPVVETISALSSAGKPASVKRVERGEQRAKTSGLSLDDARRPSQAASPLGTSRSTSSPTPRSCVRRRTAASTQHGAVGEVGEVALDAGRARAGRGSAGSVARDAPAARRRRSATLEALPHHLGRRRRRPPSGRRSAAENGRPKTLLTTKSPTKFSSTPRRRVALAELPTIAIVQASASPIISAEAVAVVRRGLRREFWPARLPIGAEEPGRTPPERRPAAAG